MLKDMQILSMRNDDYHMHDKKFMNYMTDSKKGHEKI